MKKGQTEMLGLVILVILITLSLIFLLKFLISPSSDSSVDIKLTTQASNLQSALVKTHVCEDNDIEDVMVSCCNNENICGNDACDFLNENIPKMIDNTIPKQRYKLTLKHLNEECLSINTCQENAELTSSGPFTIKRENSFYNLQVLLC